MAITNAFFLLTPSIVLSFWKLNFKIRPGVIKKLCILNSYTYDLLFPNYLFFFSNLGRLTKVMSVSTLNTNVLSFHLSTIHVDVFDRTSAFWVLKDWNALNSINSHDLHLHIPSGLSNCCDHCILYLEHFRGTLTKSTLSVSNFFLILIFTLFSLNLIFLSWSYAFKIVSIDIVNLFLRILIKLSTRKVWKTFRCQVTKQLFSCHRLWFLSVGNSKAHESCWI